MIQEIGKRYQGQYDKQLVIRCRNSSWIIGDTPNNPEYAGCELYWVYPRLCPKTNATALIRQAQVFRRSQHALTSSQAKFLLAIKPGQDYFCDAVGPHRLATAMTLVGKGFLEQMGMGSGWISVRLSEKGYRRWQDLQQET